MEREAETDENLVLVSLAGLWAIKVICPPSSSCVLPSILGACIINPPQCEILCSWTPPCQSLLLLCQAKYFLADVRLSKVVIPLEPKRKLAPMDVLPLWSLRWWFNSLWHLSLCQTPGSPLLMSHTKPSLGTDRRGLINAWKLVPLGYYSDMLIYSWEENDLAAHKTKPWLLQSLTFY